MKEFELFDLYNKTPEEEKKTFLNNINSRLEVKNKQQKNIYDYSWLDKIEETMHYLDNIIRNPKKFIINEEEVVKIEKARKVTVESVRHLTQHTNYIQEFNQQTGEVKPSKILNINKEENFDMYENRFIYTLLINMKMFISRVTKGSSITSASNTLRDIKYQAQTKIGNEKIKIELNLNTTSNNDLSPSNKTGLTIPQRIEKINLQLMDFTNSDFIKTLDKAHVSQVRSPIKKTNVILKNPNFQKAVELWTFLERYDFNSNTEENIDEEYEDTSNFRNNMNDNFLLSYITLDNLLNQENKELNEKNINKFYINKIIKDFVDNNTEYGEKEFIKLLKQEFKEIKHLKEKNLNRIRIIFQKDINNYQKTIENFAKILGNTKWT